MQISNKAFKIKHPIAFTAAVFLPLIALLTVQSATVAFIIAAISAAIFLFSLFFISKRARLTVVSVTLAVICISSLLCGISLGEMKKSDKLCDTVFSLNATVISEPVYKNGTVSFRVRDSAVTLGSILVESEDITLLERVSVGNTIVAEAVGIKGNERRLSLASEGIYISCLLTDGVLIKDTDSLPLLRAISSLRTAVVNAVRAAVGSEEGVLAAAMLTGNGLELTDASESLRTAGISHYFAVSGFHISVLCSVVLFLTELLGASRKTALFIIIPVLLFACFFADLTPSVVRAAVMCLIMALSFVFVKRSSLLSTVSFTAVLFLTFNPFLIYSVSFILSFSAVFGICLGSKAVFSVSKAVSKRYRVQKTVSALLSPVFISLFAAAFTSPALLLFFGYLPLYSLLANLLSSFLVSVLFVFLLALSFLFYIPAVSDLAAYIVRVLMKLLVAISRLIASLPNARLYLSPELMIFVIFSCLLFGTALLLIFKRRYRLVAVCSALSLILLSAGIFNSGASDRAKLTLFYGNGIKAVAVKSENESFLYAFSAPDVPSPVSEFLISNGFSNCILSVLPTDNAPPPETVRVGALTLYFYESNGGFSLVIEGKKQNIAVLPDGFSLKELYKTAFYDIIICEGILKDDYFLRYSFTKKLFTFEYSLAYRNYLEEISSGYGIEFSDMTYGEKAVVYFE
ncbi:MAG: ComEC/Rec2 family competence protein [Clostridia bacterium]|nr:ComEC/Rec2 family competence protein [Clostridia bacterium]